METVDVLGLAAHLDRVRRRGAAARGDVIIREVPGGAGGWMTAQPGRPPADFPSASQDRVFWIAPGHEVGTEQVAAARALARELGRTRVFVWVAPWGCGAETESALTAAGARPWPHVEYLALARPAGPCPALQGERIQVRVLAPGEAAVLETARAWYGNEGVECAVALVETGAAEAHVVMQDGAVVALGLVAPDGDWAYLLAAGTAEAWRRRGMQAALIRSRVERAAAAGARWCSCETNTVVAVSLRNLRRCGFKAAIRWRVFVWELA